MADKNLVDHIRRGLRNEKSVSSIKRDLIRKGYAEGDIEEAISFVQSKSATAARARQRASAPASEEPEAETLHENKVNKKIEGIGLNFMVFGLGIVLLLIALATEVVMYSNTQLNNISSALLFYFTGFLGFILSTVGLIGIRRGAKTKKELPGMKTADLIYIIMVFLIIISLLYWYFMPPAYTFY